MYNLFDFKGFYIIVFLFFFVLDILNRWLKVGLSLIL